MTSYQKSVLLGFFPYFFLPLIVFRNIFVVIIKSTLVLITNVTFIIVGLVSMPIFGILGQVRSTKNGNKDNSLL